MNTVFAHLGLGLPYLAACVERTWREGVRAISPYWRALQRQSFERKYIRNGAPILDVDGISLTANTMVFSICSRRLRATLAAAPVVFAHAFAIWREHRVSGPLGQLVGFAHN